MTTPLNPMGVSVLLAYGAKILILPPKDGRPGIRVTVDGQGTSCLLEAVDYPTVEEAVLAIRDAEKLCRDVGLVVTTPPPWVETPTPSLARVIRRKP